MVITSETYGETLRVQTVTPPSQSVLTLEQAKEHLNMTWSHDDRKIERLIHAAERYVENRARISIGAQIKRLLLPELPRNGQALEIPYPPTTAVTMQLLHATPADPWQASFAYTAGDVVSNTSVDDGVLYNWESNTTRTSGAAWDATEQANWTMIARAEPSTFSDFLVIGDDVTPTRLHLDFEKASAWPTTNARRPDAVQIDMTCGHTSLPPNLEHLIKLRVEQWYLPAPETNQQMIRAMRELVAQFDTGGYSSF